MLFSIEKKRFSMRFNFEKKDFLCKSVLKKKFFYVILEGLIFFAQCWF